MGLLTLLKEETTTVQWIFLSLVGGLGTGMLYSAQSIAVQASATNEDLPFAAAMYSFFRSCGQAFGVAIGGVVFQNTLLNKLLANSLSAPYAEVWSKDATALVQILKAMPDSEVKRAAITAYVDSLRFIWIVMCALAGLTFILSLIFTKDISLDRVHETEQSFRHNDSEQAADEEALQT